MALTASPSPSAITGLTLPTTTVVGLALGFIAAAVAVALFTILVRIVQVYRSSVRARRNGEAVSFRQAWQQWGGWWGVFFTREDALAGRAGGVWNHRLRLRVHSAPLPQMVDVSLGTRADAKDEFDCQEARPLSATGINLDAEGEDGQLSFSVLIFMPAPQSEPPERPGEAAARPRDLPRDAGTEAEADPNADAEDLPEVMLGTAVVPFIGDGDATLRRLSDLGLGAEDKEIAQIVHVEVLPRQVYDPWSRRVTVVTPQGM